MVSKTLIPLFLLALLTVSLISPVSAGVTVSFTDLGLEKNTKILIYDPAADPAAALVGEFNCTESVLLENGSYIVAFKPTESVWFQNPLNAIELIKVELPFAITVAVFLFAASGFALVFLWLFRRR